MELQTYLKHRRNLVNQALSRYLPAAGRGPGVIHRAMRYSVLGEGKRIRPILALAACETAGGRAFQALHAACALELIHAYSLVHDDLPAMDDDDFRRGKPSCHKQFGEAIGVLTGDALLTYAFELLTRANHDLEHRNGAASSSCSRGSSIHLKVIAEVAGAIGTEGMIGGQVADIDAAGGKVTLGALEAIHTRKTGALIAASVRVGALLGEARPAAYQALSRYGERIGLVFQLVDDLLDKDGLVRCRSEETVRRRAQQLTRRAIEDLQPLGRRAQPLRMLAQFILTRGS